MTLFFWLIVFAIAVYWFKKPRKNSYSKLPTPYQHIYPQINKPGAATKNDFGLFVRFFKTEVVDNQDRSEPIERDLLIDIFKNGSFLIEISDPDALYKYNINSRKWTDGMSPFNGRTPSGFISFLKEKWEEINGTDLEKIKKIAEPVSVNYIKRPVSLQLKEQGLVDLPENKVVDGSPGKKYVVNLKKLTCTCPDFKKRREGMPALDIRRLCKHQTRLLAEINKRTNISDDYRIQALVSWNAGVLLYKNLLEINIKEKIQGPNIFYIATPLDDSPWAEVLFLEKSNPKKHGYGYNFIEKRWGHHHNPFPPGTRQKYNLAIQKSLGCS